jgi:ribosomal protein L37AE/L43A
VKIKCPKCKKNAELSMDFTFVKCENCGLDMSYGEYIQFIAQNDITYSDILGDYVASTEGQSTGSLDEWD